MSAAAVQDVQMAAAAERIRQMVPVQEVPMVPVQEVPMVAVETVRAAIPAVIAAVAATAPEAMRHAAEAITEQRRAHSAHRSI